MHSMMPPARGATLAVLVSCLCCGAFAACGTDVQQTSTGTAGSTGATSGTGGGAGCVPGTLADCYTGPAGTEGVGICHGGAKKCNADWLTFGDCQWEVTPEPAD